MDTWAKRVSLDDDALAALKKAAWKASTLLKLNLACLLPLPVRSQNCFIRVWAVQPLLAHDSHHVAAASGPTTEYTFQYDGKLECVNLVPPVSAADLLGELRRKFGDPSIAALVINTRRSTPLDWIWPNAEENRVAWTLI